jgi:hypothetical protein
VPVRGHEAHAHDDQNASAGMSNDSSGFVPGFSQRQDTDGHIWVAYNDPEYVQARHLFPPELKKNMAAAGALAAAAAADA